MASSCSPEHGQTGSADARGKVFTTPAGTPTHRSHYAKTRDFCRIGPQKPQEIDDGILEVRNLGSRSGGTPFRLRIVGDGPARDGLCARLRRLDPAVRRHVLV